jgi:type II secretory pathway component PulC
VGLVWFATLGSMVGYLALVGLADKKWFDQEHAVPVITQVITVLSLALTGIVLGQIVRRARALAEEYAMRKERASAS